MSRAPISGACLPFFGSCIFSERLRLIPIIAVKAMVTRNTVAVSLGAAPPELPAQSRETSLRPWVMLASVAAFFCLAIEVELLEHIDSLSLYLTYSEIAVVAGIAL